jgi:hypothetical protein
MTDTSNRVIFRTIQEAMPECHISHDLSPLTPCNCLPPGWGGRRAAGPRLGGGGEVADRAAEAVQAPRRAAIAAARGLKRALWEARRQTGESRNDPIGGVAVGPRAELRIRATTLYTVWEANLGIYATTLYVVRGTKLLNRATTLYAAVRCGSEARVRF